jgi:plastocyanin
MQRRLLTLAVVAVLALGLAACGSSSKKSNAGSGAKGASATVTIQNFAFSAGTTVKAGATVTVDNKDSTTHTVTSDTAGQFDTGNIDGGSTKTFTAPSTPGSYPFHCNIHQTTMKSTLTVT